MKIAYAISVLLTTAFFMACASTAQKSEGSTLFITGAVKIPGRYENIKSNELNLHDLILMAGGLHYPSRGSGGMITIFHKGEYSNGREIDLDPTQLMKAGIESDMNIKLSDGDLVRVLEGYH